MKLKKLLAAAVAGVAMVSALATSAFAEAPADVIAKAKAYAEKNGITASMLGYSTIEEAVNANYDPTKVDYESAEVKGAVQKAVDEFHAGKITEETINNAADKLKVTVKDIEITFTNLPNGQVKTDIVAVVNGNLAKASSTTPATKASAPKDDHPEIAEAIANGTWGKDTTTAAAPAASVVGSGAGAVIKATGDNAGTILLVSFIAIAGILGLAVRKQGENV